MGDRDVDDDDVPGASVDGNYEALMDPDRARERLRIARERRDGSMSGVSQADCTAARNRLMLPREVDYNPERACLRGDPNEKGGVKTKEEYAREYAVRRAQMLKEEEAARLSDPAVRREEEKRLAEEAAVRDKEAFARDAEERERRLEEKKQRLAASKPAGVSGARSSKRARLSFGDDEE
mmetsp:Transcript_53034/g.119494  ORF Transcript_53034/g.119494 Transcript_53034/m.119494 type:complete len:180 (-) Transcript_53034:35-574(-)|eukprot:CAMPEP_0197900430 /NCGR_PEP_ID=MMETSP1439-20131203/49066_1 /TAXON_ID=66791 /ORGANISM="Gonyaulax spinifera, Strain CCMP409" /LENGTH=179 /DNA_ID=CAMNT_0043521313 /DNA_START=62 /DNA_END=601 /DNA_ORIENTATION=+